MSRVRPGGTLGILGGGQLGRMLAIEARRMGYRVAVLDPDPKGPTAQVADAATPAKLEDADAARRFAAGCDVVTLETEHVPASVLAAVEETTPVRPSSSVFATIQDRLVQRRFLDRLGAPQVAYAAVDDRPGVEAAVAALSLPAVLKTRCFGYDGRGQARVEARAGLDAAWAAVGRAPCVLEAFVTIEREFSVVLARGLDGDVRVYPAAENVHRHHVLRTTRVPARVTPAHFDRARDLAIAIAEALGHVGVLAVEYFVAADGSLLVNEIAPRTHNSGHYTLGACATSQFEQHVRAVCGLPLGDPALLSPAVMLNLLGDLWRDGPPDWTPALARPSAHLHLYGKAHAAPGRKMGHLLVLDPDADRAAAIVEDIARDLGEGAARPGG